MNAAAALESWSTGKPIILLVEDELLVRMTLSAVLDDAGFRVVPVAHAEEALQVLSSYPKVNLVIADVELGSDRMNGFELAQSVSKGKGTKVLLISGRAAPPDKGLPPDVGYLAKPFYPKTLVQLVRSYFDERDQSKNGRTAPVRGAENASAYSGSEVPTQASLASLPERQKQILELLTHSKSNQQIAEVLGISQHTVRNHMAALFRTLGVTTRREAVARWKDFLRSGGR